MNAYYQAQGQSNQACDFQGTATITTSNPSKINLFPERYHRSDT